LDSHELKRRLARPDAGACVTFEGWVRNHNEGQPVTRLEYEAYVPVAHKEGERIVDEARQRFDVYDVHCAHRVGRLEVGDLAVWVGVTAAHRDDAFRASRYVIDEVKARVPIWKKEHYVDGESGWVNCEAGPAEGGGSGHCADETDPSANEAVRPADRSV
jgi:molybdopterin synthase catalytic subunit